MKRIIVSFAIALSMLCVAQTVFAIDPLPFKDRAEEVRFQNLTRELRCLVCQNQNLADSEAELAGELRRQVFDMMQSGKSDAEIKQYLVARYNDFVLYDPPVKPGTWLLWFAPGVLVLIGAFVIVNILRKRTRQPMAAASSEEDW
jgi:cytochrome c-type biogenesis protein CcmH